ncbi:hypothetical protein CJ483_12595 [Bacillus sp. PK3_68]|nr:hypothetical protein CJ483_12595 [Bacillus sp. PK3_68]
MIFSMNSNRKWKLVRTVHGHESYYMVVGKLKSNGVSYKTKTPINFGHRSFSDNTQYDIYVKKEEEHKAITALREQQ